MKYLPAIDLWDNATQQAVLSGQIKLQSGQWVRCGSDKLSRFVCIWGGGLWVVHPENNNGRVNIGRGRFSEICKLALQSPTRSKSR